MSLLSFGFKRKRDESQDDELNDLNDSVPKIVGDEPSPKKQKTEKTFCQSWLKEFPWLYIEENKMYCEICQTAVKQGQKLKNNFAHDGNTNFRISTLLRHVTKLSEHDKVVKAKTESSNWDNSQRKVNEVNNSTDTYLFQTAHFIATEEMANSKMKSVIKFMAKCGHSDAINVVKSGNNNPKYTHNESINEMHKCLAAAVNAEIREDLKASDFISVIVDETTDITVHKQLIVYVRYVKNGKSLTRFLSNISVIDGKADTITDQIIKLLKQLNIDMNKVMFLASDGAAVMTGRHNGVGAKLKSVNPKLVQVHCIAHRLALTVANACKDIPFISKFVNIINNVYKYFDNSAVRYNVLREMMDVLNCEDVTLKEAKSVRWLSLHKAVVAIEKCWPALVLALGQEAVTNPIAKGLHKSVTDFVFIATVNLLIDCMEPVTRLSKTFQGDEIDFSVVRPRVSVVLSELSDILNGLGTKEGELRNLCSDGQKSYRDIKIFNNAIQEMQYDKVKKTFIAELCENIKNRFPEETLSVLDAFNVLDPANIPSCQRDINTYGNSDIGVISDHYGLDCSDVVTEWKELKHLIRNNYKHYSLQDMCGLLSVEKRQKTFPNICKLYRLVLTCPMSSVPCERGFSLQNRLRTKFRSSLNDTTLNNLMTIKSEGPSVDDNDNIVGEALKLWYQTPRRPGYKQ